MAEAAAPPSLQSRISKPSMSKLRLQSNRLLLAWMRAPRLGRLLLRALLPLPPVTVLAAAADEDEAARGADARMASKPEKGVELGVAG